MFRFAEQPEGGFFSGVQARSGACAASSRSKRAIDLTVAAFLIVLLAPLLVIVALAIRFDSAGPVIFKQRRTGLGGVPFLIYKFRTMTVCEDGAHVKQAVAGDPRVTRIGRFLRVTSIDELPQILNVLKGDMSLVGPRPHALAHDEFFRARVMGYNERFAVRPGISGLAQVRGLRGETRTIECMTARVHSDLEFVRTWSLKLDLQILARSAMIVFKGTGA